MEILEIFFYLQSINTTLAVVFNGFLVFLVVKFTRNNIGAYKWIIVAFALFEAIYALIVLMGMPVHYVAEGTWLVFNHGGIIGNTRIAFMGPALYCLFYEIWIGLIILHFIYRYVVVCKIEWKENISTNWHWKAFVVFLHFGFLAFTATCALVLCMAQQISETLEVKVKQQFNIDSNSSLGYILLRHKSTNGVVSILGTFTIFNHYLLVGSSVIIIMYCSVNIWRSILAMQSHAGQLKEVKLQRQMFFSLVIQTAVPVIFCHIPSAIYLSFPFWEREFSFGVTSLVFTWVTTVNKVVDPLIVIACISEYRRTTVALFKGRPWSVRVSSTGGVNSNARSDCGTDGLGVEER